MNITLVTFDPPENIGGIEGRSRTYAAELRKRGHSVKLLSFSQVSKESREPPHASDVMRLDSSVAKLPSTSLRAIEEIRNGHSNSVLLLSGSLTFVGFLILLYSSLSGIVTMSFVYGRDILRARKGIVGSVLLGWTLRLASIVVVNSNFTAALLATTKGKTMIIRPSVNPSALKKVELGNASSHSVLFVGRLVNRKGADLLLESFREVSRTYPDAHLDIVGDGPELASLRQMCKNLQIESNVEFRGILVGAPLYQCYADCDVFVMPSRSSKDDIEGFGTVFIEAGLFGKPAVGTMTGGITEAIQDGKTGLLVPENDAVALTHAILRILGDQSFAKSLGVAAQERVMSEFTIEGTVDRIESAISRERPHN